MHPLRYYINQDNIAYFSFDTMSPFFGEIDEYVLVDFGFALNEQAIEAFSLAADLAELFKQPEKRYSHNVSGNNRTVYFAEELKELGIEPGKYPRKVNMYQLQVEGRNVVVLVNDTSDRLPTRVLTKVCLKKHQSYSDTQFTVVSELRRYYRLYIVGLRPVAPARMIPVSPLPIHVEEMTIN